MKAKQKRRKFLKISSITSLGIATGGIDKLFSLELNNPFNLLIITSISSKDFVCDFFITPNALNELKSKSSFKV